jgi:DNA-binding IclR family transcriptional regulator
VSNPLDRAFQLLDIVASARRPVSLVELVQRSGLPQSSTYRLASNLVETGMLTFDAQSKTYSPGSRAHRLSLLLGGADRIEDLLDPALESIASAAEETSFFVLATHGGPQLVRYKVPELGARAFVHPGFTYPLHATATGKVIAAFGDEDLREVVEKAPLERFQPETMTDKRKLLALLADIRKKGYAVNDGELDRDVFSAAAPVFHRGHLAGALGFVGPANRISGESAQQSIHRLLDEAARLSQLLAN